ARPAFRRPATPVHTPLSRCPWPAASRSGSRTLIMPKMKTKKAASKRFHVTGGGRVRRSKCGGNHGMQEKSRKRIRRLRNNDTVHAALERHVKRLLPYG